MGLIKVVSAFRRWPMVAWQGPPGEGLGVVVVENTVKGCLEVREVMACIVIRHMDEAAGGSIQKVREAGKGGGWPAMEQAECAEISQSLTQSRVTGPSVFS